MEEIDRFQVPTAHSEMQPLDPAAASISDGDCDAREGESVAMNYKPSPLQVKLEKQRELARKGSLKNGSMGSPVNQQPKKNNVMARTRLVVPNKGYSSLDQSPDEKPLVALDTDRCKLYEHTSGLYRPHLLYCQNVWVPPSLSGMLEGRN
uniref:Family with sequence similarity 219 member A n=1 Tax=Canis lupus dingo TaxID=286419 RepID=A0A8C0KT42_CANLU